MAPSYVWFPFTSLFLYSVWRLESSKSKQQRCSPNGNPQSSLKEISSSEPLLWVKHMQNTSDPFCCSGKNWNAPRAGKRCGWNWDWAVSFNPGRDPAGHRLEAVTALIYLSRCGTALATKTQGFPPPSYGEVCFPWDFRGKAGACFSLSQICLRYLILETLMDSTESLLK